MPSSFLSDENWLEKARKHCLKYTEQIRIGMVVSGDSFINDSVRKEWIEEKFPQALAVEMEASAIAQTCHLMNTPFLMLRAISDNAGEGDTVSYDTFVENAGRLSAEMNIELIKSF